MIIDVFEIGLAHIAPQPTSFDSGTSVSHILQWAEPVGTVEAEDCKLGWVHMANFES
jgi:hypothetical protein